MQRIPIDFSEAPGLEKEFLEGRYLREVMAAKAALENQTRLNALAASPHRSVNGLGSARMYVDPFIWSYWARREGSPEVWKDRQHLRYMRDAGMEFVKSTGTKIQVGWTPSIERRFKKSYA